MIKHLLFTVPAILTLSHVYCQPAGDSTEKQKNHLKAGLQYISNQTYAGRTDSLRLHVLSPSLNFQTKPGFYVKATGYFNLSKNNNGFDGISLEPGYEFSKNNWDGSASFIKNFISDSSNLIIAPVKASLEFYLGKETKIVTPYVGAEYVFSSEGNDFIAYGGLSKLITLTPEDKEHSITLEPSLSFTGGTQNFYYSFLKSYAANGRGKGKGRGRSGNPVPLTQTNAQDSKQFTLLAVGFELPVTVTKNKLEWKTTPAWESPLNLVDTGGAGTQQAKSYLYVTTELVYSF